MLILAHRGASQAAPENTLSAFREAVAQQADGVELDVQRCATGEVVVCHDERLDRLAGVDWAIRESSLLKLRRADVGTRLGFGPERIPLLEEVFALLPPHLLVNVELKCESLDDGGLTRATVDLIHRLGLEERVLVSSFNPLCLVRLAELAPKLRRGYLIDPDRSFTLHARVLAPLVSSHSVHPYYRACTPAHVRTWKAGGYALAAWTVDGAEEARRLRELGVDYLITNRPGQLRAALA